MLHVTWWLPGCKKQESNPFEMFKRGKPVDMMQVLVCVFSKKISLISVTYVAGTHWKTYNRVFTNFSTSVLCFSVMSM